MTSVWHGAACSRGQPSRWVSLPRPSRGWEWQQGGTAMGRQAQVWGQRLAFLTGSPVWMDEGSATLWAQTQGLQLSSEAPEHLRQPSQRSCIAKRSSTGLASRLWAPAFQQLFYHGLSLAQAHILSVGKTFCAIVFNFFLRKSLHKQFQPNWYQLKASFWHFVLNYKCTLSCVCYPCWYVTGKMRNDREDAFLNGSGRFQCSLLWASWQENPPPAGEE